MARWDDGSIYDSEVCWDEEDSPTLPANPTHRPMANNDIPRKKARVFTLAERMAAGCKKLGTVLGIKQNTEAVMVAAIANARAVESD